ncbi:hypothetical protein GCM10009347_15430 [Shewanella algicola]|uniref:Uncharacterized protein n=1 Tax=Shewanella algicola TaxID=640633 RepID=A0A9X1Z7Z1_9GAMM|nr:hypothetical protein [Shewanella algicola]MCL1105212.1 hypothetical protein [Shewanella algicola]GGP49276.1 hypothetical protein GCM10009347_15430 [Shewanella algicola]
MATPKNDKTPVDENVDDSAAYEMSQRGSQIDDPLEAIKAMRLGQLSVCRLKTEHEMQAMVSKATSTKTVRHNAKTDD